MSAAAMTQLFNVSSPREGQARLGQRCIASPSGWTTGVSQSGQRSGIRNGFVPGACGWTGPDDLRDDVAGALDDHHVALADVLPVDVLLVVEGRARDSDAADLDGLEHRPWVERAGATDADRDLEQLRRSGRGRPLVRARPARPLVQSPEAPLLVDRVDLDHDAVDLVVELDAPALPLLTAAGHLLDRLEPLGVRVGPEAVLAQPREHLELRLELQAFPSARCRTPRPRAGGRL